MTNDPRDATADRIMGMAAGIVDDVEANLPRGSMVGIVVPHIRYEGLVRNAFEQEWARRGYEVQRLYGNAFYAQDRHKFIFRACTINAFRGFVLDRMFLPSVDGLNKNQSRELRILDDVETPIVKAVGGRVIRNY